MEYMETVRFDFNTNNKLLHMRCIKLFLILACFMIGCSNEKKQSNYKFTIHTCSNLFVEVRQVFGSGAYGGDLHSNYLTDSISFRLFIGEYDNYDEGFIYDCKGDSIIVKKIIRKSTTETKITKEHVLSLKKLKKMSLLNSEKSLF